MPLLPSSGPQLRFRLSAVTMLAVATVFPAAALDSGQEHATVALLWNDALLQAVRESRLGPPMVARALAIVHGCMYEAWAAYDKEASGMVLGRQLLRPPAERTPANVNQAVSYAAYRCSLDLFPGARAAVFDPLMERLGYPTGDASMIVTTPPGVGNLAAAAVLASRRNDGANQAGNLTAAGTPYADYTNYVPVNSPSGVPVNPATVTDPDRWQPLQYIDATGTFVTQKFLAPFWGQVTPFALRSGDQLRPLLQLLRPSTHDEVSFVSQAQELVDISANLTDEQKTIAEYWADGPGSETPPGHWNLVAEYVSRRDHHKLADDIKMFFVLNGALLDASIVAWDAKRVFDSVRPITAIPYLFAGTQILSWGGPGRGTVTMDGRDWLPYQSSTLPTPPFAEFPSGHSTFSAAAATVLALFTGSDDFGASVSFAPGTSKYEPGTTPRETVTLNWNTFSEAADQAGLSRRYGGIHFRKGDYAGRIAGRVSGLSAWRKAALLWKDREHHHRN